MSKYVAALTAPEQAHRIERSGSPIFPGEKNVTAYVSQNAFWGLLTGVSLMEMSRGEFDTLTTAPSMAVAANWSIVTVNRSA